MLYVYARNSIGSITLIKDPAICMCMPATIKPPFNRCLFYCPLTLTFNFYSQPKTRLSYP